MIPDARACRNCLRWAATLAALAMMLLAVLPHATVAALGALRPAAASGLHQAPDHGCHRDDDGALRQGHALPCCQGGCALLAPAAPPRLALPSGVGTALGGRTAAAAVETLAEPPERPPRPARS